MLGVACRKLDRMLHCSICFNIFVVSWGIVGGGGVRLVWGGVCETCFSTLPLHLSGPQTRGSSLNVPSLQDGMPN